MSDNKKATTALASPGTTHSLEERRLINEDVLKVTGHELKREFSRRVEEAKAMRGTRYDDLGDYMHAYNEAAEKCWTPVIDTLKKDLASSFDVMNSLASKDTDKFEVSVSVDDRRLLFGLEGMERDGYYHLGETALAAMREALWEDEDAAKADIDVLVEISVRRGSYVEISAERTVTVKVGDELVQARKALVEKSDPFYEAVEAMNAATKALADLPANLEELDMQATARRIRDMGGEDVLRDLLASATSVLDGEAVKGLAASLPDRESE